MNLRPIHRKGLCWAALLMFIVSIFAPSRAEAVPLFSEGSLTLTLQNASQSDTLLYGLDENITLKFITTNNHSKAELSVEDYREATSYLDKVDMTETDNGDGTYTYSYTFNTDDLFEGTADWYYFKTQFKGPTAEQKAYFVVGNPGTPYSIKTFSDAAYSLSADSFELSDTVYVEVVGNDNGNDIKKEKIKVLDYSDSKYIDSNIGDLNNNNGVFRFSLDLSTASPAFTTDWWYTLEVEIEQDKVKGEKENTSFLGGKQIRILPSSQGGGKNWTQQKWREVD